MARADPEVGVCSELVVGVAILARVEGRMRVLLGRRARPAELAGRWEFPGGKVEAGESANAALRRECREELGVEVTVGRRLGADLDLPGGRVLRVWTAGATGTPRPLVHDELRWVAVEELEELDWIPADRPLLPALREVLRAEPAVPAADRTGPDLGRP